MTLIARHDTSTETVQAGTADIPELRKAAGGLATWPPAWPSSAGAYFVRLNTRFGCTPNHY